MYFYPEKPGHVAMCRSMRVCNTLQYPYRRIFATHDYAHVVYLSVESDTDPEWNWPRREIDIAAAHRPHVAAWACGDMPSWAFADFLQEYYEGRVPDAVLALLREPCENP